MAGSWGSESDDLGMSSDDGSEHEDDKVESSRAPQPASGSGRSGGGGGGGVSDTSGPAAPSSSAEDESSSAAAAAAREGEEAELLEYAKSLGIDLQEVADADLRWVVKEAFDAPLPISWTEHLDEEGRVYFFNQITQESSWLHPMDAVFKEVIELIQEHRRKGEEPAAKTEEGAEASSTKDDTKKKEGASKSTSVRKHETVQAHLEKAHQEALSNMEHWSGPYSSEAGQYYYNATHDVSSWENPIDELQKQLALRQRILHKCLLENDPLPPGTTMGGKPAPKQAWPEAGQPAGEGVAAAAASASSSSGQPPAPPGGLELLEVALPRLPLALAMPPAGDGPPKSPSSTRSFATARSGRSARSARSPTPTGTRLTSAAAAASRGCSSPKSKSKPKATTATPKVASTASAGGGGAAEEQQLPRSRKGSGDGEELEFTFGSTQNLQLPRFGHVAGMSASKQAAAGK